MASMRLAYSSRRLVLVLAALALLAVPVATSQAGSKETYYFLVHDVRLVDGIPAEVGAQVRDQLIKAIGAHERLIPELPKDAPDPQADPKAFEKYLKKHKIKPYRVNVDVKEYRHELEELAAPRRGQRLTVGIVLYVFGETMPQRTMAFSGDGSSTVKLEIGKKLRARDTEVANGEAVTIAVNDALKTSLERLEAKEAEAKKKARRGKK